MNNQKTVRPHSLQGIASNYFMHPKAIYQSGAVLIISLVMLLLLTLIGTTSMQSTSLEEKMVGNMREQNIAFQTAEAALRAGEVMADADATTITPLAFTCDGVNVITGGYYNSRTKAPAGAMPCTQFPSWQAIDWTDINKIVPSVDNMSYSYYIEQLDSSCGPCGDLPITLGALTGACLWYRITARGTGSTNKGVVLLQSTYSRFDPSGTCL